ncbi:hypothetical protein JCM33374_g258 [Metschnikowia sp. JCM 33374]|nr:hypothetical protein JCM33374_g258 [Metschnikowia sp. JCM 33374]
MANRSRSRNLMEYVRKSWISVVSLSSSDAFPSRDKKTSSNSLRRASAFSALRTKGSIKFSDWVPEETPSQAIAIIGAAKRNIQIVKEYPTERYRFCGCGGCVECNPEDSFLELPAIVTKMNAKIDAKNLFLKHGASSAKEIRYDDYLLQMETMSPDSAVIEPFDFTSMRPSRAMAAEIFKKIPPTGDIDTGSILLDQEKKLRFLSRISSLDFEKDTRLSYGELFRD